MQVLEQGAGAAAAAQPGDPARPGDDLPEVPGEGAGRRYGSAADAGRRPEAGSWAASRSWPGRWVPGSKDRQVGQSTARDRRPERGRGAHRDRRPLRDPLAMAAGEKNLAEAERNRGIAQKNYEDATTRADRRREDRRGTGSGRGDRTSELRLADRDRWRRPRRITSPCRTGCSALCSSTPGLGVALRLPPRTTKLVAIPATRPRSHPPQRPQPGRPAIRLLLREPGLGLRREGSGDSR